MTDTKQYMIRGRASVGEISDLKQDRKTAIEVLKNIRHATAPTHDDGASHENAYELATLALYDLQAFNELTSDEVDRCWRLRNTNND